MTESETIKPHIMLTESSIEFQNVDDIYFPNTCIVCGAASTSRIEKTLYSEEYSNDQKKDYHFSLPICKECWEKSRVGKGLLDSKEGKRVVRFTAVGVLLSILIGLLTYSIIFSISIFLVFFLIPFFMYKEKTISKIVLSNYFQIFLKGDDKTISMTFLNKNYMKYLNWLNHKKTLGGQKPEISIDEITDSKSIEYKPEIESGIKEELVEEAETSEVSISQYNAVPIEETIVKAQEEVDKKIEEYLTQECEICGWLLSSSATHCPKCKGDSNFEIKESVITSMEDIPEEAQFWEILDECSQCGVSIQPDWEECPICQNALKRKKPQKPEIIVVNETQEKKLSPLLQEQEINIPEEEVPESSLEEIPMEEEVPESSLEEIPTQVESEFFTEEKTEEQYDELELSLPFQLDMQEKDLGEVRESEAPLKSIQRQPDFKPVNLPKVETIEDEEEKEIESLVKVPSTKINDFDEYSDSETLEPRKALKEISSTLGEIKSEVERYVKSELNKEKADEDIFENKINDEKKDLQKRLKEEVRKFVKDSQTK